MKNAQQPLLVDVTGSENQRDKLDICVIILTLNEELHIARAIEGVNFAKRVIVVDSGSTDRTCEIAQQLGAEVYFHAFSNHARQLNWALTDIPHTTQWIMRLDADERLSAELIEEIESTFSRLPLSVTGINLRRRQIFQGYEIRHGGRKELVLLRIWRTSCAIVEDRWMDEHVLLLKGTARTFEHPFYDDNLHDLTHYMRKHNNYATNEAVDRFLAKHRCQGTPKGTAVYASWQPKLKRSIKESIYNRLPFLIGPTLYFILRYVLLLGFLDGRMGLIYHLLQGFFYRVMVEVKYHEIIEGVVSGESNRQLIERCAAVPGQAMSEFR